MDLEKFGSYIKKKRLELGMTQQELANKLSVTEEAVSRWEKGRGTPDISLLEPLANVLNVSISDILDGDDNGKKKNESRKLIEFALERKKYKYSNVSFIIPILLAMVSFLVFFSYLKYEYSNIGYANYFLSLGLVVLSSFILVIGISYYNRNYVDKIANQKKMIKLGKIIIYIYYIILLFNVIVYSRAGTYYGFNFIPFATIMEVLLGDYTIYYKIINLLGNSLFFVPLGYFLIDLFKVRKFFRYFLLVFLFVLCVECLQIVFKCGVFDIDDIILNVGSLLIIYFISKKTGFSVN